MTLSATYQNISTFDIGATATYLRNDATIVSTLGRPLAGSSARIALIPTETRFDDRINQLDVRVIKAFNVGPARVQGIVDVYNLFNNGAVINQNGSYGSSWLRPLTIADHYRRPDGQSSASSSTGSTPGKTGACVTQAPVIVPGSSPLPQAVIRPGGPVDGPCGASVRCANVGGLIPSAKGEQGKEAEMRVRFLGGWSVALLLSIVTLAAADSDVRLIEAIKNADTAAVRALLPGSDVNARAGDGATALHWAAYKDDLVTADLLIRTGAAVNAVNDLGVTPLWVASTNASAPMIATLLSAGADPDVAPPTGGTPLMLVSRAGNPEAVTQLLAHGADVNAKEGARNQTALMWAVAQREPEIVRLLLAAGADVDARSKISRQVVFTCCPNFNGDNEGTIEVEQGGFTPLMFAAREGAIESAGLLVAAGANANDTTPPGTSVMVVAAHSGHGTLAVWLLEHGADPNAAGTGYTALHAAVLRSDLDLVKALLAHGANPNARLTKGTPVRRHNGGGNGIAFNKSWIGATPFLLATKFLELDLMRVLVAGGADVAVPMEDGTTSVMAVLYSQREKIRAGTDTSEPPHSGSGQAGDRAGRRRPCGQPGGRHRAARGGEKKVHLARAVPG